MAWESVPGPCMAIPSDVAHRAAGAVRRDEVASVRRSDPGRCESRSVTRAPPSGRGSSAVTSVPSSTRAPRNVRRWSSSTGSRWSCGTDAGAVGLRTSLCARVGKLVGWVSPASASVGPTHCFHSTSTPPARTSAPAPTSAGAPWCGADRGGPRQPGQGRSPVDHDALDPVAGQRDGRRQAGGPGADHEHGGRLRSWSGGGGGTPHVTPPVR